MLPWQEDRGIFTPGKWSFFGFKLHLAAFVGMDGRGTMSNIFSSFYDELAVQLAIHN